MTASSRLSGLLAAGLILAALAGPAAAHGFKVGAIEIEHPWSRATPPGARTGAGYFAMSNMGPQADRLVSAHSARAETVEVHRMSVTDGVMTLRDLVGKLSSSRARLALMRKRAAAMADAI